MKCMNHGSRRMSSRFRFATWPGELCHRLSHGIHRSVQLLSNRLTWAQSRDVEFAKIVWLLKERLATR